MTAYFDRQIGVLMKIESFSIKIDRKVAFPSKITKKSFKIGFFFKPVVFLK